MKKRDILISVIVAIILALAMIFFNFSKKDTVIVDKSSQKQVSKESVENENTEIISKNDETQKEEVVVYISGEVANPQVVTMKNGDRLIDAVQKCGGMTKDADTNAVNLALLLKDEQHYIVPKIGEVVSVSQQSAGVSNTSSGQGLVNINTADKNALMNLPSVGEKTAEKIINYRTTSGNFKSIEDLKNVPGIGDKKFEQLKDLITV